MCSRIYAALVLFLVLVFMALLTMAQEESDRCEDACAPNLTVEVEGECYCQIPFEDWMSLVSRIYDCQAEVDLLRLDLGLDLSEGSGERGEDR